MKTDVVVVGSGAAGLMAALSAAQRGAAVTVLERSSLFGGTSALSGAGTWLPNNHLQAQAGIPDSAENARLYLKLATRGTVSDELIEAFVSEAPKALEFLCKETGLEFAITGGPARPGADRLRSLPGAAFGRTVSPGIFDLSRLGEYRELLRHPVWPGGIPPISHQEMATFAGRWGWVPLVEERIAKGIAGRGHALVAALLAACLGKRVQLVPNARVGQLIIADGRITGVMAVRDAASERYDARLGVVLACGGFEWNAAMWDDHVGWPLDGRFNPPLGEGDGFRMALQAGARIGGLQYAHYYAVLGCPPDVLEGAPRLRLELYRPPTPGAIVVNVRGQRFANEADNPDGMAKEMARFDSNRWEFPNSPAFLIFDRLNRESHPLLKEDWSFDRDGDARPDWMAEAPTVRGLAEKVGIDPDGLEAQVKGFNRHAERGEDPAFLRDAPTPLDGQFHAPTTLRPLGPGPFYAVRQQVGTWTTRGGPVVNGDAQVLDRDDRPIAGLYAAGTTAKAVTGSGYVGGGTALGPVLMLGFAAGRSLTKS